MVLHESIFGQKGDVESIIARLCFINGKINKEFGPLLNVRLLDQ
jgi:hypothetical protein